MLLRAISGLIRMDGGKIIVNGEVLGEKISFPQNVGIVIENMQLLPECSAKKNLEMLSEIKKIAK